MRKEDTGLDGSIRRPEIMQVPTVSLRGAVLRAMKQFFNVYRVCCAEFIQRTELWCVVYTQFGLSTRLW